MNIKVTITNKVSTRLNSQWVGLFETQNEAEAWVASQQAKAVCPWGDPERWIRSSELTEVLQSRVLETRLVEPSEEQDFEAYEESYVRCDYDIVYGTNAETNAQEAFKNLRKERDDILTSTDFTQLADAPFDNTEKSQYREYRSYLRSLPSLHNEVTILNYTIKTFEEFIDS